MTVETAFQNIADAIRTRAGSSGVLTPAQMPQAILDIPGGGGGSEVITSLTTPVASQGVDGDIWVQYAPFFSGQTTFKLNILRALRGSNVLTYAGAAELDITLSDGINNISIRDISDFTYAASGGQIALAFDGNPSTYWENYPTPIWATMSATIPNGYVPTYLRAMRRSTNYTSDVWQEFNLSVGDEVILARDSLTVNDWSAINTYTDFAISSLPEYRVVGTWLKINGVWTITDAIDVTIQVTP